MKEDVQSKLWSYKLSRLKLGSPDHPILKDASKKDDESLLQKGCQSIYDSSSEENDYLEDFRNYCSRLVEDTVFWNWIEDDGNENWNSSLTQLKQKKDNLVSKELRDLANKLVSDSGVFSENERRTLKDWCRFKRKSFASDSEDLSEKGEIYSYCISNTA